MALIGEHHGKARRIGGGNHLIIAHRAAGLDDCGGPGLGGGQKAIGEGEERIRGHNRTDGRAFIDRLD